MPCQFCGSTQNVKEYGDATYSANVCDSQECQDQFNENYMEACEDAAYRYRER